MASQFEPTRSRIRTGERDPSLLGDGFDWKISDFIALSAKAKDLVVNRIRDIEDFIESVTNLTITYPIHGQIFESGVSPLCNELENRLFHLVLARRCRFRCGHQPDSIISYLTRRFSGNVDRFRVVTLAWQYRRSLADLADLHSDTQFAFS
jgi:hypothetical protein